VGAIITPNKIFASIPSLKVALGLPPPEMRFNTVCGAPDVTIKERNMKNARNAPTMLYSESVSNHAKTR
jgi:hypothetical protein